MLTRQSHPVLLVEDTRSLSALYESYLRKAGFDVECAYDAENAIALFDETKPRIVLLDLVLPDRDGLAVLRHIHGADPAAKIVVITANGSINRAVEAMREGAFDFLVKPFDERRLIGAVENAVTLLAQEERSGPESDAEPGENAVFEGFIGRSAPMRRIYGMVQRIARSTATVFITGESGTGKEVCAQAIHNLSVRRKGPFVPVNCGAIPRDLLESELFGHLRGSFTGAVMDKPGAAAVADRGTLFLDEVCEMDLALQTKLLRFLQTSMIQPVGATEAHKVDVRIVCATNRDPAEEVKAGRFREDLYYRLHVVPIHLPPLREREEDVVDIAEIQLRRFSEEEDRRFQRLSDEARRCFLRYPWPGNVRELQNVLRNVVVLHDAEAVTPEMLPEEIRGAAEGAARPAPAGSVVRFGSGGGGKAADTEAGREAALHALVGVSLADLERRFIEATIEACNGSIPKAARLLDVSPSTLYRKRGAWSRDHG